MNKLKIALLCGQARYYEKINVYNPDIYTWKHKNNIAYFSSWNNLGQLTISNDDIYKYIDFIQTSDEVGYEKPNKLNPENGLSYNIHFIVD